MSSVVVLYNTRWEGKVPPTENRRNLMNALTSQDFRRVALFGVAAVFVNVVITWATCVVAALVQ
jgi:hypothetical protein